MKRCFVLCFKSLSTLCTGIIGNHQEESSAASRIWPFFSSAGSGVVAQGMDDDRRVLPRLDDFVQIDDRAMLTRSVNGPSTQTVYWALEQIPPHQIGAVRSSWQATVIRGRPQPVGHMLTNRVLPHRLALEHDRHFAVAATVNKTDLATDLS